MCHKRVSKRAWIVFRFAIVRRCIRIQALIIVLNIFLPSQLCIYTSGLPAVQRMSGYYEPNSQTRVLGIWKDGILNGFYGIYYVSREKRITYTLMVKIAQYKILPTRTSNGKLVCRQTTLYNAPICTQNCICITEYIIHKYIYYSLRSRVSDRRSVLFKWCGLYSILKRKLYALSRERERKKG